VSDKKALKAIALALAGAEGLDPRTQKAVEKAQPPRPFGRITGIRKADTEVPGIADADLAVSDNTLDPPGLQAVAKIPPALARALGERLVKDIPKEHRNIKAAFVALQKKYPRLMGHVQSLEFGPQGQGARAANFNPLDDFRARQHAHPNSVFSKGVVSQLNEPANLVDPDQINKFMPEIDYLSQIGIDPSIVKGHFGAATTAAHELTHAAQRLVKGNKFIPQYRDHSLRQGYFNNPMEESAREAGENFAMRHSAAKGQPVLKRGWALETTVDPKTGKTKYVAMKQLPGGGTRKK
jgi:hypothetical protein